MNLARSQAVQSCMVSVDIILKRIVKRGFFANLADCSPAPIHVDSNSWGVVLFHPIEKVRFSGESRQHEKNFSKPLPARLIKLAQERIRIAIDIAQECQIKGISARR